MSNTAEDLIIHLRQIPAEGLDVDLTLEPEIMAELLGNDREVKAKGATHLQVRLLLVDDVVHVRGKLRAGLGTDCGRCGDGIALQVSTEFEFACFPEGGEPSADADGEVTERDMEVAVYRDDQVELGQVIRDEIFLNLPMYPDCTVSVSGRCADYDEKLKVADEPEDAPGGKLFEALKNFKLDKPD